MAFQTSQELKQHNLQLKTKKIQFYCNQNHYLPLNLKSVLPPARPELHSRSAPRPGKNWVRSLHQPRFPLAQAPPIPGRSQERRKLSQPSVSPGSLSADSSNYRWKIFGEKISRNFQKLKLEFAGHPGTIYKVFTLYYSAILYKDLGICRYPGGVGQAGARGS